MGSLIHLITKSASVLSAVNKEDCFIVSSNLKFLNSTSPIYQLATVAMIMKIIIELNTQQYIGKIFIFL